MMTPFTMPDGTVTSIGEKIPPITMKTIELALPPDKRAYLAKFIGKLAGSIYSPTNRSDVEIVPGGAQMDAPKMLLNEYAARPPDPWKLYLGGHNIFVKVSLPELVFFADA